MTAQASLAFADRLGRLPRERTYVLPALHLLHEEEGYITAEGLTAIAKHLRVPNSELYGIARSYSEFRFEPPAAGAIGVCMGLSCRLNGSASLAAALRGQGRHVEELPCRFRCDEAPVAAVGHPSEAGYGYIVRATPEKVASEAPALSGRPVAAAVPGETRRVTARCGRVDPESIASARAAGSYEGLAKARALSPEEATAQVLESGLQGRGGAYFPAGRKWQGARAHPRPRYLVVNFEEGEPGVFKDRYLVENDPHLLVEGLLIAAHAMEAERVYVYVNGEANLAARRLEGALAQAREAGLLGEVEVEVRRGAGGYVCGEESVILSSIEGERAVPRLRPPLPVDRGLWGRPTVINNVETLANLPFIFREGVAAFRSVGTEQAPGTKVLCVSGAVRRPGVYEVALGTPLRAVLYDLSGGPRPGRTLRAAVCGGPSGGLLPAAKFDTPLLGGPLDPGGAALGAGGIVALDETLPLREVVYHLTAYNAAESCGKCTPCREGSPRLRDLLAAASPDVSLMNALEEAMAVASLCGLGQMAPLPYRSLRTHFPEELAK